MRDLLEFTPLALVFVSTFGSEITNRLHDRTKDKIDSLHAIYPSGLKGEYIQNLMKEAENNLYTYEALHSVFGLGRIISLVAAGYPHDDGASPFIGQSFISKVAFGALAVPILGIPIEFMVSIIVGAAFNVVDYFSPTEKYVAYEYGIDNPLELVHESDIYYGDVA